jgi:hypothetical protein
MVAKICYYQGTLRCINVSTLVFMVRQNRGHILKRTHSIVMRVQDINVSTPVFMVRRNGKSVLLIAPLRGHILKRTHSIVMRVYCW